MVDSRVRRRTVCTCSAIGCARDGATLGRMDDCMFCLALHRQIACPRARPTPPTPKKASR